jgi:small subunit ribosomal protein S9
MAQPKTEVITGRRKTAVARVVVKPGHGSITVNGRPYQDYFPTELLRVKLTQPFKAVQLDPAQYDIVVNVSGGGITGQAEAIRLAVAKALLKTNDEFRKTLRAEGLLTRDPRMVERKKYGRRKARRRFQFSKR